MDIQAGQNPWPRFMIPAIAKRLDPGRKVIVTDLFYFRALHPNADLTLYAQKKSHDSAVCSAVVQEFVK